MMKAAVAVLALSALKTATAAGLVDNPIEGSHIQYLDSSVGTSVV